MTNWVLSNACSIYSTSLLDWFRWRILLKWWTSPRRPKKRTSTTSGQPRLPSPSRWFKIILDSARTSFRRCFSSSIACSLFTRWDFNIVYRHWQLHWSDRAVVSDIRGVKCLYYCSIIKIMSLFYQLTLIAGWQQVKFMMALAVALIWQISGLWYQRYI